MAALFPRDQPTVTTSLSLNSSIPDLSIHLITHSLQPRRLCSEEMALISASLENEETEVRQGDDCCVRLSLGCSGPQKAEPLSQMSCAMAGLGVIIK